MSTLDIEETRRRIAAITERCAERCPGWDVFESNSDRGVGSRGLVLCRCDECFAHLPEEEKVYDDDIAALPEAQQALAAEIGMLL